MSDPCRTIHLDGPIVDLEAFLEAHFLTPDKRLLPLDAEPWNLSFNVRRGGRNPKCEACGNSPRGRVLMGMRHRRAPAELFCCRLCSLKLNGAAPEVIAAEAAKVADAEARLRRCIAQMQNTATWETPAPGVQIIRPNAFARVELRPVPEGWEWTTHYACAHFGSDYGDTAATIEDAFSEAGWEFATHDGHREWLDELAAEQRHAEACEAVDEVAFHAEEVEGPRRLPAP